MQRIPTYKEYKQSVIKKAIEKNKPFTFEKVDNRYHYIYRVTNLETGLHYYGSRTSNELDIGIKYFTSSNIIRKDFKKHPENYKYKIIRIFDNTKDKEIYESYLHQYFNVKTNDKFYNRANQTPFGFDTTGLPCPRKGKVNVINTKTNEIIFITCEEYHNNKNKYTHVCEGKVNVIDNRTGEPKQITTEEYHNNKNKYTYVNKGKVTAVDKRTGETKTVTKEDFDKYDYYISINKNKLIAIDNRNGKRVQITKEEYHNNKNNYTHVCEGKINAFNTITNKYEIITTEEYACSKIHKKNSTGMTTAVDKNGNHCWIDCEEYRKRDDLVSYVKDRVTAIDKRTGETVAVTKEEFQNNSNLAGVIIGKVIVIDKRTGEITQVTKEEFNKYDYYISCNEGKSVALDTRTNKYVSISKEEFNKYPYYVGPNKNKVSCYDKILKKKVRISRDEFKSKNKIRYLHFNTKEYKNKYKITQK